MRERELVNEQFYLVMSGHSSQMHLAMAPYVASLYELWGQFSDYYWGA